MTHSTAATAPRWRSGAGLIIALLAFTLSPVLAPTEPASAAPIAFSCLEERTIPVVRNPLWFLTYYLGTEPGTQVVTVRFEATYSNLGSGLDAADAAFDLHDFDRGISWRISGADLGWSGEGTFSGTTSTSRFSGPVASSSIWESINQTFGVSGDFDVKFIVTLLTCDPSFAISLP